MTKYLSTLLVPLLALLLLACGGAGEANDGDGALPPTADDAATNRVTLDGLTFSVRETPG